MKQQVDFKSKKVTTEQWYDIYEDWSLIEASFAKQYGIRIRRELNMSWQEFSNLLSSIMPDTPLGEIVSIRSETNKKVIKSFNSTQRKIHTDWKAKQANKKLENPKALELEMKALEKAFEFMYGNNK